MNSFDSVRIDVLERRVELLEREVVQLRGTAPRVALRPAPAPAPPPVQPSPVVVAPPAFAAVGSGIAGGYATLLAATALYGLLPGAAGLVVSAGIALAGTATALAWRSELIAGLGLIGAALAPLAIAAEDGLSSTGTG